MKLANVLLSAAVISSWGCGCSKSESSRVEWTVMGTVAALQTSDGGSVPAATALAQTVFSEVEKSLNAHNPHSELSRLASHSEKDILEKCDPRMRQCYAAAFALHRTSAGAFNPRWRGENKLDLGAIAKGFAVDLAATELSKMTNACSRMLLDLGGNLKSVVGVWTTGVRDPNGDGCYATVKLHPGEALATSAEYFRGKHIHDGRTGLPVSNAVASVTVLSPSAMIADGLSTTLFVLGPDEGNKLVTGTAAPFRDQVTAVLWILRDGQTMLVDRRQRFSLAK